MTGVIVLAAASAVGASAYAYTASNTVSAHKAGAGSAAVTGYTITGPTNYTFSADGTTMVDVSFDLSAAASDVQVALTAAAPTQADWTDCGATSGGSNSITNCAFPSPVAVGSGAQLTVAAVSTGTVTIAP